MTINDRINIIIDELYGHKQVAFASAIGVRPSVINGIVGERKSKPSFELLQKISELDDINIEWLIKGRGNMRKSNAEANTEERTKVGFQSNHNSASSKSAKLSPNTATSNRLTSNNSIGIPLVSETAVGGFSGEFFQIQESDILGHYNIPKFRNSDADFLIEVRGDSMTPRISAGDIIACSIIRDSKFIQWNKIHLLATREQGLIVKRLLPSKQENCLLAVSDNPDYVPFDIPKDEIVGIARVVGNIHLE